MSYVYIQFRLDNVPHNATEVSSSWWSDKFFSILGAILSTIIPKGNPDFDGKIKDVTTWCVEIDEETGMPEREIGIDRDGNTIMIMPFGKNYGYWTDNNLRLEDFKERFEVTVMGREEFEKRWERLGGRDRR